MTELNTPPSTPVYLSLGTEARRAEVPNDRYTGAARGVFSEVTLADIEDLQSTHRDF